MGDQETWGGKLCLSKSLTLFQMPHVKVMLHIFQVLFMCLEIEVCLSEMKVDIITLHANRNVMQFLNARYSIAGLLPASFLYK